VPRLTPLTPPSLSPAQRRVYDAILKGRRTQGGRVRLTRPDGSLVGPFDAWLRSPEIGNPVQALGEAIRFTGSFPKRLQEVAILTSARHWRAEFEWWAHARLAREAGVEDQLIDAIRTGRRPDSGSDDELLVIDFSRALLRSGTVEAELYDRALQRFGEDGLLELVCTLGFYALVSFTLNVFEVPLPEGEVSRLEE